MLLLTLTLASIVGCVTTPKGDFCDVNTVYRPDPGVNYTDKEKRWIIAFNEYGEKHCGWKP